MSSVVFQSTPPYNYSTLPMRYVVYTPDTGANFYARNGKTGANDYGPLADPTTVLQNAITNA